MSTYILHPITNNKISLFSTEGIALLKHYVRLIQNGGNPESCQKCHQFYKKMVEYGTSPNSATTLQTYNFCINCAEQLLQDLKKYDSTSSTYKQITKDAKVVINNGEQARKNAERGGIDLTKIRQQGMDIRRKIGSTVRSSVSKPIPRTKCQQAMQIANYMLNKLYEKNRFSISFSELYTLMMHPKKSDKIFYINPNYEQEYETLLLELYVYIQELKERCSSPNRSKLVNILRFFIETSDTDGGTANLYEEFPSAPSTSPSIQRGQEQPNRIPVPI
jgi:hypothetical protein